jgi:hypothetical protein
MFEARVKQFEKQAREDFTYSETLLARLAPFLRKEAVEKEVTKKEAVEKEAARKEAGNPMVRVIKAAGNPMVRVILLCQTSIFNNLHFNY